MGIFDTLNGKSTIKDGITLDGMEYKSLKDFIGDEIKVDGFYFNSKSKYGEQVVIVGNGYLINMPQYTVEKFKAIRDNDDMLAAVLAGKLALTDIKEIKTKNGTSTGFNFKEC